MIPGAVAYREVSPPPTLGGVVECSWQLRGRLPGGTYRTRVLPDGCMDVLFSLGALPVGPDGSLRSGRALAVGAMRQAAVFRYSGEVDVVGIRFRPGGGRAAMGGVPAHELTDLIPDLATFWGSDAEDALDGLAACRSLGERAPLLFRLLARRLGPQPERHWTVTRARALMRACGGRRGVGDLSLDMGVSQRTLGRRFAEEVGLSPKEASRIERFRVAVRRLAVPGPERLARVALASGYHDQAHFNREFRALAGVTPGGFQDELRGGGFVQDADGPQG